jgi:hypothetical protein
MKFVQQTCATCGSDSVAGIVYAKWDHVTQEWVATGDDPMWGSCSLCSNTEVKIVETKLEGDELIEARAHYLASNHGWYPGDEDTAIEYCDLYDDELDPTKPVEEEQ